LNLNSQQLNDIAKALKVLAKNSFFKDHDWFAVIEHLKI
jgi:hypothetical protein